MAYGLVFSSEGPVSGAGFVSGCTGSFNRRVRQVSRSDGRSPSSTFIARPTASTSLADTGSGVTSLNSGNVSRRTRSVASTGVWPESARYATAPRAYMSVHGPWLPCVLYCSIGAYPGVKTAVSDLEIAPLCCLAEPKSIRTGVESLARNITFAGLMSRCSSPSSWTSVRPAVRDFSITQTCSSDRAPTSASSSARLRPSTYSMIR